MRYIIWLLVLVLLIIHQDNWFWNDPRLVFGFIPVGLFYHACISIAAATIWYLAIRFAWPVKPENAVAVGENSGTIEREGQA